MNIRIILLQHVLPLSLILSSFAYNLMYKNLIIIEKIYSSPLLMSKEQEIIM